MAVENNGVVQAEQSVGDTSQNNEAGAEQELHDPYFEPIVNLPLVDTLTLEEDEEELFKERCKLFRFVTDKEDGGQWKERGTGDVKLLKNEGKGLVRLLMRQEKTLKIRANHYLTPYLKLKPNCDSDRAFVWHVMVDFADEESKGEMFAIKFANAEKAAAFKGAFDKGVAYVACSIVKEVQALSEALAEARECAEEEEEEEEEDQEDEDASKSKDVKSLTESDQPSKDEKAALLKEEETSSDQKPENQSSSITESLSKLNVSSSE